MPITVLKPSDSYAIGAIMRKISEWNKYTGNIMRNWMIRGQWVIVDRVIKLDCENDDPKEYQRILAAYEEDMKRRY